MKKLTEKQKLALEKIRDKILRFDKYTEGECVNSITAESLCKLGLASKKYVYSERYLEITEEGLNFLNSGGVKNDVD